MTDLTFGDPRLPRRFWQKVRPGTGCWQWIAATSPKGYGYFWSAGKVRKAHRTAYQALIAPIPEGLTIDHLCRNASCVNPEHMEPVTTAENSARGNAITKRNQDVCGNGIHPWPDSAHSAGGKTRCLHCARATARRGKERRRQRRLAGGAA